MKRVTAFILLVVFSLGAAGVAPDPLPRKSPDFVVNEPSGGVTHLASFKGKVVVVEFLFLRSAHCLRVADTMNKLYKEMGPRGLQAVAIAFPAPGSNANGPLVEEMAKFLKLTYPAGYSSASDVDLYLNRSRSDVLNIPQVVVIDRAGMIRAQSGGRPGDPKLENEDSLRTLLDGLLKEDTSHKH